MAFGVRSSSLPSAPCSCVILRPINSVSRVQWFVTVKKKNRNSTEFMENATKMDTKIHFRLLRVPYPDGAVLEIATRNVQTDIISIFYVSVLVSIFIIVTSTVS